MHNNLNRIDLSAEKPSDEAQVHFIDTPNAPDSLFVCPWQSTTSWQAADIVSVCRSDLGAMLFVT
jgi:hypothetical protein